MKAEGPVPKSGVEAWGRCRSVTDKVAEIAPVLMLKGEGVDAVLVVVVVVEPPNAKISESEAFLDP